MIAIPDDRECIAIYHDNGQLKVMMGKGGGARPFCAMFDESGKLVGQLHYDEEAGVCLSLYKNEVAVASVAIANGKQSMLLYDEHGEARGTITI